MTTRRLPALGAGTRTAATSAGLGALAVTAAQALPMVVNVPPLRRFWPVLAGSGDPRRVALTFDDGPDGASTPQFIDELDRLGVTATFFLLGEMAQRFPSLPRRLVDAGHEVAVHSWDHRNHLRHTPARAVAQLADTRDLLHSLTGVRPRFFRPPYGALTGSSAYAARRVGLQPVLWTAWGRDWERRATPESVRRLVGRDVAGGANILLHDSDCTSAPGSWRATLAAVPGIVADCRERGLVVGPLRDHGLETRRRGGQP